MVTKVVTERERAEAVSFWRQRGKALNGNPSVSVECLLCLSIYTQPNCIGYGQGKIRPGKLGQWDMYYFLTLDTEATDTEALLISGLTATEVADNG